MAETVPAEDTYDDVYESGSYYSSRMSLFETR